MTIRTLRFVALLLAALAMGMHLAHALELVPKLRWSAELYLPVQSSLYAWFGRIGPVLEIGALIAVSVLALRVRGQRKVFVGTLISVVAIVLALLAWAIVVLPANAQLSQWLASSSQPADWAHWRGQWQYGQAGIFVLHLIGYSALIGSVLADTPDA